MWHREPWEKRKMMRRTDYGAFRHGIFRSNLRPSLCVLALSLLLASPARAQSCFTSDDMDAATHTVLVNTAKRYFDMAAKGDSASLRQNSIASLASDFS